MLVDPNAAALGDEASETHRQCRRPASRPALPGRPRGRLV